MKRLWTPLCLALPFFLAAQMLAAPAQAEELPTVTVTARNGHFEPEVLEVPAGKKFKIIIKNDGPGPAEFESTELQREKVINAGASSFLVFQPLKAGSYVFFDDFHRDTAKGKIVAR